MDSEERISAGILWTLQLGALNGHTCLRETELSDSVERELSVSGKQYWEALKMTEQRG